MVQLSDGTALRARLLVCSYHCMGYERWLMRGVVGRRGWYQLPSPFSFRDRLVRLGLPYLTVSST